MFERFVVAWKYPLEVTVEDLYVRTGFLRSGIKAREYCLSDYSLSLKEDLERYFTGEKVDFSKYRVKIKSEFVRKVLDRVRKIGYGETVTYGDIAKELRTSPRAVGQALKANPAPVVIPCHRVVSKNGIGGYSQGVDIKLELLKLEKLNVTLK